MSEFDDSNRFVDITEDFVWARSGSGPQKVYELVDKMAHSLLAG